MGLHKPYKGGCYKPSTMIQKHDTQTRASHLQFDYIALGYEENIEEIQNA